MTPFTWLKGSAFCVFARVCALFSLHVVGRRGLEHIHEESREGELRPMSFLMSPCPFAQLFNM